MSRYCPKCNQDLEYADFYEYLSEDQGWKLSYYCKECEKKYKKEYYVKQKKDPIKRLRMRLYAKNWYHKQPKEKRQAAYRNAERRNPNPSVKEKMCRDCYQVKKAEDFYSHFWNNDGLGSYCKECQKRRVIEKRKAKA